MRRCILQRRKFPPTLVPRARHVDTTNLRSLSSAPKDFLSAYRRENKIRQPKFRSASFSSDSRPDPFARRPTAKCDPYDQGGKPLTLDRVLALKATVEPEWEVVMTEDDRQAENDQDASTFVPFAIRRVYWHEDYMQGAEFSKHVAAVAQMNAQHFPHEITLTRKLDSKTKTWRICTEIVCRTFVLQGLSHHDFYLATLIDIEAQRPEVRGLLVEV